MTLFERLKDYLFPWDKWAKDDAYREEQRRLRSLAVQTAWGRIRAAGERRVLEAKITGDASLLLKGDDDIVDRELNAAYDQFGVDMELWDRETKAQR